MKNLLLIVPCFCFITSIAQNNHYERIDTLLSKWDKSDEPGFAIGIIKGTELVYAKGLGSANLDYNVPNTTETVFRIASTSKQFTAACILLLEKQGLLRLEDSLTKFFPKFPSYANKITISHLLHHTSGLRDYLVLSFLAGMRDEDYYTDEEIKNWLINQQSLNFEPGSDFTYSNSGYWLLGQIVKQVSGKTLAEFAKEHLFEPLKMSNTHFHDDPTLIVKNRATGYTMDEEETFKISETILPMTGDGGVFTTISDFKKWMAEYYNQSYLDKAFWTKMTTPGILNNGEKTNYACGLMVSEYKGIRMITHGGSFVGYLSSFILFPDEKSAFIIFTNRNDISPASIAFDAVKIVLNDKIKKEETAKESIVDEIITVQLSVEELNPFTGNFEIQPGMDLTVSIERDSLRILQNWNNASYPVTALDNNTFGIPGAAGITFEFSEIKDGKAQILTLTQGGTKTACKRKSIILTSGKELLEYAGAYYSDELLVSYMLFMENDTLKCKVRSHEPVVLTPSSEDTFGAGGIVVNFNRKKGIIQGFTVNAGRVKGIKFTKEL